MSVAAESNLSHLFQLKATIAGISPMIWRRFLVLDNTSLAQLHYILQIAFGWGDYHLHRFVIHAKDYGIYKVGGMGFADDADTILLGELGLRSCERFLYEYDFRDCWQVQLRVEDMTEPVLGQSYPQCSAGKRSGPPEDCGGPMAFQALRQEFSSVQMAYQVAQILISGKRPQSKAELRHLRYWLLFETLNLSDLNRRLQQPFPHQDPAFTEEVFYTDS